MSLTLRDARKRVAAGVERLRAVGKADSLREINLRKLKMDSECACILGQLYGDYYDGTDALYLSPDVARMLGFTLSFDDATTTHDPLGRRSWLILKRAWAERIKRLRSQ